MNLVEAGFIDVIVSTGAIVYQDLYQALGYKHYMGTPKADDAVLHDLYIDRIYDAYVDEVGFVKTDDVVGELAASLPPRKYSTREFMREVGLRAAEDPDSIIGTAAKRGVPIFGTGDCRFISRHRSRRFVQGGQERRGEVDAARHDTGQLRDRADCFEIKEDRNNIHRWRST